MKIFNLLFCLLISVIVLSQEPEFLNVYSIDLSVQESSNSKWLTETEDYIYFTADDGIRGRELWKLEKATDKISIVKDIKEGDDDSFDSYFELGGVLPNNVMIFFPCDSPDGSLVTRRLWRTDGTEEGTYKILDLPPGIFNDNFYVNYNDEIYFTGETESSSQNLYKSDGTIEGTVELKYNGASIENVNDIFLFNNSLYFTATYEEFGLQLWKTNGTNESVELVTQIGNSNTTGLTSFNEFLIFNNHIYFYANDGVNGNELWKSNGELNSEELVKDIYSGSNSWGDPNNSNSGFKGIVKDGYFLFSATDDNAPQTLFRSDGTEEGTFKVATINISNKKPIIYDYYNSNFISYGNLTIFNASKQNSGDVLWVTDGTAFGTNFLMDFYPGNNVSNISDFALANNFIYLLADESFNSGNKLWRTDGTIEGTIKVADFKINSNIKQSTNGNFYFSMFDDFNGFEINKFNPLNESFTLTQNVNKLGSTLPQNFTDFNEKLLFTSNNRNLYLSNGIFENTAKLNSEELGLNSFDFISKIIDNNIFFNGYTENAGSQLYKYNESLTNVELVKQFEGGNSNSIYAMESIDQILFFNVHHNGTGSADKGLWISDGTPNGTTIINGTDDYASFNFVPLNYNNTLYFSGRFPNPHTIYKTDDTSSGTNQALSFPGNYYHGIERPTILEKFKDGFLIANYESSGNNYIRSNLYFSKGLQSNTIKLKDVQGKIYDNSYPTAYGAVFDEKFIFFERKQESPYGIHLYVTDGTPAGTTNLNNVNQDIYHVIPCGSFAYFLAQNNNQMEIYQTNGTSTGTFLIDEFNYNKQYEEEYKNFFTCSNNSVLLYAPNEYNIQIKATNGISSKVFDLNFENEEGFSGDERERIKYLYALNDKLYLSIYKRDNGAELYTSSLEDIELSTFNENNLLIKSNISIYPNPADGDFNVLMLDNSNIQKISIYDLSGKLIKNEKVNHKPNAKVNIQNLTKGIYLISVETINGKFDKKIIVK